VFTHLPGSELCIAITIGAKQNCPNGPLLYMKALRRQVLQSRQSPARADCLCCLPCCRPPAVLCCVPVCPRSMLYRLMKHTCLNCHQFKMGRQEVSGATRWWQAGRLHSLPFGSLHCSTVQCSCPHSPYTDTRVFHPAVITI